MKGRCEICNESSGQVGKTEPICHRCERDLEQNDPLGFQRHISHVITLKMREEYRHGDY